MESIEFVRESSGIREEWFGLILLPFVSFSADGAVAVIFFCQAVYDRITNKEVHVPSMLARGRAIDLSIQFTLWWMPFLVLLGWWTDRPMHLLFGERLPCSAGSSSLTCFVPFRLLRGGAVVRLVLPRQLRHRRREDELGGGFHYGRVLHYDRECATAACSLLSLTIH